MLKSSCSHPFSVMHVTFFSKILNKNSSKIYEILKLLVENEATDDQKMEKRKKLEQNNTNQNRTLNSVQNKIQISQ